MGTDAGTSPPPITTTDEQHEDALLGATTVRSSLDLLMDPCVMLTPVTESGVIVDFHLTDANEAACRYNHVEFHDLIGSSMLTQMPEQRSNGLFDLYTAAFLSNRALHLDGFRYSVDVGSHPAEFVLDIRAIRVGEALSVSWRDDTERSALHRTLERSEERFRMLAENSTDVVIEIDLSGRVVYASPSTAVLSGFTPEQLQGGHVLQFVATDDVTMAQLVGEHLLRGESSDYEMRLVDANGDHKWNRVRVHPLHDENGRLTGAVLSIRDIHSEMLARRAASTLTAANSALVRTTSEPALLEAMCTAAVEHGGYPFAWYCRPLLDTAGEVGLFAEAGTRSGLDPEGGVNWCEGDHRSFGPTGTALRTQQATRLSEIDPALLYSSWNDHRLRAGFRAALSLPVFVDGSLDGVLTVYDGDPDAFDDRATEVLHELSEQLGIGLGRLRTGAALAHALDQHALLTTAIEQSAEAVVITDPSAAIIYANPAAVQSSGYSLEEMVGQNPRILKSGLHGPEFYRLMWSRLAGGRSFHGTMLNRRKNGELYEEDATITPVHSPSGELMAYVGVKRELSREARLTREIDQYRDDSEVMLELMRQVRPADTFEGTAAMLCTVITRFDGFDGATLLQFKDKAVVPFGMTEEHPDVPLSLDREIPVDDVGYFASRTQDGAWWLDLDDEDGPASLFPAISRPLRAAGFHATAYAPVRWDGEMIAVLSMVTSSPTAHDWLPARLSTLEEFAGFAGLVLGEQAIRHEEMRHDRAVVIDLITNKRFEPVFQPIVDLRTGAVRGYEALTRFHDGVDPEHRFTHAHDLGLGAALERACAEAAIAAAVDLPPDRFLALNFSPVALMDGTAESVVRASDRPLVLEITEQFPVESYPAARRALQACRPALSSVDDAGAGFASLRHIVELAPDMVKLDRALVRDIDRDPARQALAAGLCHFAQRSGTLLVAEGVERGAEEEVLRELGVDLAQGYRFGRPSPLR